VVNLDAPPASRWPYREMAVYYNESIHEAVALIDQFIPGWLEPAAIAFAEDFALPHLGEYAEELKAGAPIFGIPLGVGVLLNIIYEVEAGCTSIIAQDPLGTMYHARNLDFNLAPTLRKLALIANFQKSGKTLFWGVTYAGYLGVLTGMRPGAFGVSLNERDSGYRVENLLESLLVPGTNVASFLMRDTLTNYDNFDDAVKALSTASIVAPAYLAVSGSKPGQGVIITRDRLKSADIWKIDNSKSDGWFLVETNDDHWLPPEDDRREIAINGIESVGRSHVDLDTMFRVLSTNDVLNSGTTYTTLMSPTTGNFTVFVRTSW